MGISAGQLRKLLEKYEDHENVPLEIIVSGAGVFEGTNTVKIEGIHPGFDWYQGRLLITPSRELEVKRKKY